MRAMAWTHAGDKDGPRAITCDAPSVGRGQVRLRVMSTALNPADWKVTGGEFVGRVLHARVSPLIVGYDYSGVIDAVGEGVTDLKPGDAVFGHLAYSIGTRQGTFAELVSVDRSTVARKPDAVTHEAAAAVATAGLTALQSMRDLGRLRKGGHVLIVGAAGGVGSVAIGVARRLEARVTAVCSSYAADFVRQLGADEVVDRTKQDPMSLAGPFDVVFDAAAAHSYSACKHLLTPEGAYVATLPSVAWAWGKVATLFSHHRCELIRVQSVPKDLDLLAAWIADGMQVPIDGRFPVKDVQAAISRMMSGKVLGRLSIQVDGGFSPS
jgi:NADPH:quinone reductase-like Zn-dependent oxidoreductase